MDPGIEFQDAMMAVAGKERIIMKTVKKVLMDFRGRKRIW